MIYWNGSLDNFSLWTVGLTEQEIQLYMNNPILEWIKWTS